MTEETVNVSASVIQSLVELVKQKDAEIRSLRECIENLHRNSKEFTPTMLPRGMGQDCSHLSATQPISLQKTSAVSDAMLSHRLEQSHVENAVRAARVRVKQSSKRGSQEDYVLESGFFRSANSCVSPIPKELRNREHSAARFQGLSPRRQVELYGFVQRRNTPGPGEYSPLYNRAAQPPRK